MQDLRFALRQLLKSPGFTAVAVLTLALGIGANTVVFSVARTVLLRPLGFEGEDRLMWIRKVNTQTGAAENQLSWQDLEDVRSSTQSFESVVTDSSHGVTWQDGNENREIPAMLATPNLAQVLRIKPVLGRLLESSDAEPGAAPVVLISSELWKSRFGGRPDAIGQSVRLDDKLRTIVGVLPAGVEFPVLRAPQPGRGGTVEAGTKSFWIPMSKPQGEDGTSRAARMFLGVGRLKPGVSEAAARLELDALSRRLAEEHPESNRNMGFSIQSIRDQVFGRTSQGVPLLGAAVAAVLLICCVNLANLLLARGVGRQRELAVRAALGAGRGRLLRALLAESLLLALIGGVAGVLLAAAGLNVVKEFAAATVPFIQEASLDRYAVGFTAGISVLTALVFGLLPAVYQSRAEASDALRTGVRSTGGPQVRSWQQGLLVGQIAVVLVLLMSAALLLESFRRLVGQDLGYQPRSVITMDLSTRGKFETNGDVCRMYRSIRERLRTLPGVEAVGTVSSVPLTGRWTFSERPDVVGRPVPPADRPSLAATFVAFDYFQAMGIPLIDGRFFRDSELEDDGYGKIVLLNESAAKLLFPDRSAVGGRFTVGSNPDRILEVVGVVKDTRDVRLEERPQPRFYWQYAFGGAQVVVRGNLPEKALMPLLRAAVMEADSRLQIVGTRSMSGIIDSAVSERRFLMILVGVYSLVAMGVAAIGVFGVVTFQVAQRTSEFGLRLALGATRGELLRLVMTGAGRFTGMGLSIGLLVSLGTNRLLANHLFGLSPHDPVLLLVVSLILFLIALLAGFLPAKRASRIDPMSALREE